MAWQKTKSREKSPQTIALSNKKAQVRNGAENNSNWLDFFSRRRRTESSEEKNSRKRRNNRNLSESARYDAPETNSSHDSQAYGSRHSDKPKIKRMRISDDPEPSFISICRFLITLEEYITAYSNEIRIWFNLSLKMEREKIGSSNQLLTKEVFKKFVDLKFNLKDQIVLGLLPEMMVGVARSFVNELGRIKLAENVDGNIKST